MTKRKTRALNLHKTFVGYIATEDNDLTPWVFLEKLLVPELIKKFCDSLGPIPFFFAFTKCRICI
jgi:hypothetical protein